MVYHRNMLKPLLICLIWNTFMINVNGFYVPEVKTKLFTRVLLFTYILVLGICSELKEIAQKFIFNQSLKNPNFSIILKIFNVKNCFVFLAPPFNSYLILCVSSWERRYPTSPRWIMNCNLSSNSSSLQPISSMISSIHLFNDLKSLYE